MNETCSARYVANIYSPAHLSCGGVVSKILLSTRVMGNRVVFRSLAVNLVVVELMRCSIIVGSSRSSLGGGVASSITDPQVEFFSAAEDMQWRLTERGNAFE